MSAQINPMTGDEENTANAATSQQQLALEGERTKLLSEKVKLASALLAPVITLLGGWLIGARAADTASKPLSAPPPRLVLVPTRSHQEGVLSMFLLANEKFLTDTPSSSDLVGDNRSITAVAETDRVAAHTAPFCLQVAAGEGCRLAGCFFLVNAESSELTTLAYRPPAQIVRVPIQRSPSEDSRVLAILRIMGSCDVAKLAAQGRQWELSIPTSC